jgi:hypothetical protein
MLFSKAFLNGLKRLPKFNPSKSKLFATAHTCVLQRLDLLLKNHHQTGNISRNNATSIIRHAREEGIMKLQTLGHTSFSVSADKPKAIYNPVNLVNSRMLSRDVGNCKNIGGFILPR